MVTGGGANQNATNHHAQLITWFPHAQVYKNNIYEILVYLSTKPIDPR